MEPKRAVGVICEYNPFHRGHAAQIAAIRAAFPQHICCMVMSGNFVQRGECAVTDAYTRAAAALSCGADLVLELIFPYSTLPAQGFAESALSILARLGGVEVLAFGAETQNLALLSRCGQTLGTPAFETNLRAALEEAPAAAYAHLRERELTRLLPEAKGVLRAPNNILAVEYCRAIHLQKLPFEPFLTPFDATVGAGELRALLAAKESIAPFVPAPAMRIYQEAAASGAFPAKSELLSTAMLFALREGMPCAQLKDLGARLSLAAQKATDFEDFVRLAKTRKISRARVRRGVLHAYLGAQEPVSPLPPYTILLAAGEAGRAFLNERRRHAALPIYTKPARALREEAARSAARIHAAADSVFAGLIGKDGGWFLRRRPEL